MTLQALRGKRVLVTGGAGFIGSHLVDALLAHGSEVRVLDDFSTGKRENLSHVRDRVDLLEGSICDLDTCQRACEGATFVLHQAALGSVPRSMSNPARSLEVNVSGTANVFMAARDCGVSRVVYGSQCQRHGECLHGST
jgi:UDP-N-acetylglucosamine 4-epimerase